MYAKGTKSLIPRDKIPKARDLIKGGKGETRQKPERPKSQMQEWEQASGGPINGKGTRVRLPQKNCNPTVTN